MQKSFLISTCMQYDFLISHQTHTDMFYDNIVIRKIIPTVPINILTYFLSRVCAYLSKTWQCLDFSLCKWICRLDSEWGGESERVCVCVCVCVRVLCWTERMMAFQSPQPSWKDIRPSSFFSLHSLYFLFLRSDCQLWYIGLVFQLPWKLPSPLTATTLVDRISGNSDSHCI